MLGPPAVVYVFELIGEDDTFATYEAAALASELELVAPGIALATAISSHIDQLAWTRSISKLVCRTLSSIEAVRDALRETDIDGMGSAAVRARAVRGAEVDTQRAERSIGAILNQMGYTIELEDPDRTLRVLFSECEAFAGWVRCRPGGDVGRRRPTDRLFFQPGSMAPRLARGLVNIAGIRPGDRLVDPMCGTGGIVLEGALVGAHALGVDVQDKMVRGSRRNCRAADPPGTAAFAVADARRLPITAGQTDAVVVDVPYGRQSKISGRSLVPDMLAEVRRITDRAVVVADRPLTKDAKAADWTVRCTFDRPVHRSLTRHIVDLGP